MVLVSILALVAVVPFAAVPLRKITAFIPSYESALAVVELVTAVLLFGRVTRSRSRAFLALACGYLFNTAIIACHALSFPGVFSETGLFGPYDQTTAWLYVFWHGGFPLFVLCYALLPEEDGPSDLQRQISGMAIVCSIAGVLTIVTALTLLAAFGGGLLPIIIQAGNYSRMVSTGVSPTILVLSALALFAVWRRNERSVLDVWLMVVMGVWLLDVTLSAVVSSSRYDLGWYGGRTYGFMAGCCLLIILLLEMNQQTRDAEILARKMTKANQRIATVNKELEEFAYAASHDLKAPLRVIDNASKWLEEDLAEHLTGENRENMQLLRGRVGRMEKLLDDLLEYSRVGRATDGRYVEIVAGDVLMDNILALLSPPQGFVVDVSPAFAGIQVCRMPLQQILMNLVSNAIKHHDKASGRIEVTVEDIGADYVFAVKDDGPGIPTQFQDQVFKMFQTLKPRDQVEGSGMGLAMVLKNIEVYGGTLDLESSDGKGSVFRFIWPKQQQMRGENA